MNIDLTEKEKEMLSEIETFYKNVLKNLENPAELKLIEILLDPSRDGHLKFMLIENRIENATILISLFGKMQHVLECLRNKYKVFIMKETHIFTSDQKLEAYGYGEWVEEPDIVEFSYNGIDCTISRIGRISEAQIEPGFIEAGMIKLFLGDLCGYIKLPEGHPFTKLKAYEIPIDSHWGLSFGEQEEDGFWIGFDCGHMNDLRPGLEIMLKKIKEDNPMFKSLSEDAFFKKYMEDPAYKHLFTKTYRNIDYCIGECKSMVDQLLALEVNK